MPKRLALLYGAISGESLFVMASFISGKRAILGLILCV